MVSLLKCDVINQNTLKNKDAAYRYLNNIKFLIKDLRWIKIYPFKEFRSINFVFLYETWKQSKIPNLLLPLKSLFTL